MYGYSTGWFSSPGIAAYFSVYIQRRNFSHKASQLKLYYQDLEIICTNDIHVFSLSDWKIKGTYVRMIPHTFVILLQFVIILFIYHLLASYHFSFLILFPDSFFFILVFGHRSIIDIRLLYIFPIYDILVFLLFLRLYRLLYIRANLFSNSFFN